MQSTSTDEGKPLSTGQPNVRTGDFKKMLERLPDNIQQLADRAYRTFLVDPFHPMLENHELHDSRKGRHRKTSRAVSITRRYRAIYVSDGPTNVCYWIGSHEDYNRFVG